MSRGYKIFIVILLVLWISQGYRASIEPKTFTIKLRDWYRWNIVMVEELSVRDIVIITNSIILVEGDIRIYYGAKLVLNSCDVIFQNTKSMQRIIVYPRAGLFIYNSRIRAICGVQIRALRGSRLYLYGNNFSNQFMDMYKVCMMTIEANNVVIENNNIIGNGPIFCIKYAQYISVRNNKIRTGKGDAINIIHSQNISIKNNTIGAIDGYGISIFSSSSVEICGNRINSNKGITISRTKNLKISNNIFVRGEIHIDNLNPTEMSSLETKNNTDIYGKKIVVLFNKTNAELKNINIFQLIIAYCKDLSITNASMNHLLVYRSINIEMRNITLKSESLCLDIMESVDLNLSESRIKSANRGICVSNSSSLKIEKCYLTARNGYTLFVESTYSIEISHCIFDKTPCPIKMENSSSIIISNNHILCGYTWNESKIVLSRCINISIKNNIIEDTRLGAMNINDSSDIQILNNSLTNMFIYTYDIKSNEIELKNNTINNLPLLLYKKTRNTMISDIVAGQILLLNCNNVSLIDVLSYSIFLASSYNISIERSCFDDSTRGLNIYNCEDIYVSSCNISSCMINIYVYATNGISIEGSNFSNAIFYDAIIRDSMKIIVAECIISSSDLGLYIFNSSKISILNNSIFKNERDGILVSGSHTINIIGNVVSLNGGGISLYDSYNIYLSRNSLSFDTIHLYGETYMYRNITITDSNKINDHYIHYFYGLQNQKISGVFGEVFIVECKNLTMESSVTSGLNIYGSEKIRLRKTSIFGGDEAATIIKSNNVYLNNVSIYNNSCGMRIAYSTNVAIKSCQIETIENGMMVDTSSNVSIESINIKTGEYGLYIHKSSTIKVVKLSVKNTVYGFVLSRVKNTTISSVEMDMVIYGGFFNCTYLAYIEKVKTNNLCKLGISVHESAILVIDGTNIMAQEKCLYLNRTSCIWVTNNTFTIANIGVDTTYSASILITRNTIMRNSIGLRIADSYDIIIANNKIYDNDVPIIIDSSRAKIYDNDLGDHRMGQKLLMITVILGAIYWLCYFLFDMDIIKKLKRLCRKC